MKKNEYIKFGESATLDECLDSKHNGMMLTDDANNPIAAMIPFYDNDTLLYGLFDLNKKLIKSWVTREDAMRESFKIAIDLV